MKFVSALTDAQRASLEQLYRHGSVHRLRQRAQAVLLSAKGFTMEQIACACEVHAQTISGWLNQWQQKGLSKCTKVIRYFLEAIQTAQAHQIPGNICTIT